VILILVAAGLIALTEPVYTVPMMRALRRSDFAKRMRKLMGE
jgi:hypothetical protein